MLALQISLAIDLSAAPQSWFYLAVYCELKALFSEKRGLCEPPKVTFYHFSCNIWKATNISTLVSSDRKALGFYYLQGKEMGFPNGSDDKESLCNARDPCPVPEWGRSPGEGNGNPLQYSCLESSMDRGAWQAIVDGVTDSRTQMSDQHTPGKEGSSFIWLPLLLLVYCLALQLWNLTVAPCLPFCLANEWMNKWKPVWRDWS